MRKRSVQLDEICDIRSGGTPSRTNSDFFGGSIPWAKISDIERSDGTLTHTEEALTEAGLAAIRGRMFKAGTLLFAIYGSIGKMAFAGRALATNQAILGLSFRDNVKCYPRYVYHWLLANNDRFLGDGQGIAQKNLSAGYLRELQLPLPPLDEQRQIAAILDKADALRRKRIRALEVIDGLTQSIFLEMFGTSVSGKILTQPLSAVTSEIYRYPTYFGIEYVDTGIPEIRGELILENGSINDDKGSFRFISQETSDRFPRTQVEVGDLVMSVRGTIGKIGRVPKSLDGANITANLIKISPDKRIIESDFLWFAMKAPDALQSLASMSASTTIATVKASDLKKIPILCPPLEQQIEFTQRARVVADERGKLSAASVSAFNLFSSLQHRAFTGQL